MAEKTEQLCEVCANTVTEYERYKYKQGRLDLADELRDKLLAEIGPSQDKWERGWNAGVRFAVRQINRLIELEVEKGL